MELEIKFRDHDGSLESVSVKDECDMREPSVLRVAPVPSYNSFTDVHCFVETLGEALKAGDDRK